MNHNLRWFVNRINKKIYCNDHENGFDDCQGIIIESKDGAFNVMQNQKRGIKFQENPFNTPLL